MRRRGLLFVFKRNKGAGTDENKGRQRETVFRTAQGPQRDCGDNPSKTVLGR